MINQSGIQIKMNYATAAGMIIVIHLGAIAFDNIKLNHGLNQLATIPQQYDAGLNLLASQPENFLPAEIFNSNSHFDFYRIDGELHRLVTCN